MIKKLTYHIIFPGILLFLLFSCDPGRVYENNEKIPDRNWHKDQEIVFNVPIQDTVSPNNVYINVRNEGQYEFSNLYVFMTIISPQGNTRKDTINLQLAKPSGEWLGKGFSSIYDHQVTVYENIIFPVPGEYKIVLEQAMRKKELEHILDIGIRVEKITGTSSGKK